MEKKNVTEVVIDGVIYRLGGYESSEYLQQVAGYLNNKTTELKALDGYQHLPTSQKALMMELNIADDYFKAKKQAEILEDGITSRDKEIFDLKLHPFIHIHTCPHYFLSPRRSCHGATILVSSRKNQSVARPISPIRINPAKIVSVAR